MDFPERGPKSKKGDQKGTTFCQKSPKGTFPLLGDLLVYTGFPYALLLKHHRHQP